MELIDITGIILAAGKGTRMKSTLPKVLHPVGDRPMLASVGLALAAAGIGKICVVASDELLSEGDELLTKHPHWRVVVQKQQKGTADAVATASYVLPDVLRPGYASGAWARGEPLSSEYCLICNGDTPALDPGALRAFVEECRREKADLGVLGMNVPEPQGYGRIIKDEVGRLQEIVEEKDADAEIRKIRLVNTGVVFARTSYLFDLLGNVVPSNKQGEYYLTDCFALSRQRGQKPLVVATNHWQGFAGVNDLVQLAGVEDQLVRARIAELQRLGVRVQLPGTVYVGLDVQVGSNTNIAAHASLSGATRIGSYCKIGHGAVIVDSSIDDEVEVGPGAILKGAKISKGQRIAPYQVWG